MWLSENSDQGLRVLQRGKLRPSGRDVVREELPFSAPPLRLLLPMGAGGWGLGAGLAATGVAWETHGLPSGSLWSGGMTVSASRPTGPRPGLPQGQHVLGQGLTGMQDNSRLCELDAQVAGRPPFPRGSPLSQVSSEKLGGWRRKQNTVR